MSTINPINSTYTNSSLAYLLNGNSNNATTKNSGNPTSLAAALNANDDNNSSDGSNDDLYTLLMDNSGFRKYSLPTDSSGNTFIPTIDQMNNASTPDNKLTLAQYVAQFILVQADALSKTGNPARATEVLNQAQSTLDAVSAAVSDLAGESPDDVNKAASQQTTVSTTLNTINTAVTEIKGMMSKATAGAQTSIASALICLDTLGSQIASATGVAWTSVTGNDSNTVQGYSADSTKNLPGYDTLNSLVNVTA